MNVRRLWQGRRYLRWPLFALALVGLAWGLNTWLPPAPRWAAEGKFNWATFSPDGSRVLTVCIDHLGEYRGPVQVRDSATGRVGMQFALRVEEIIGFDTSADFRRWVGVVKLKDDPTPRLWVADIETGQERDSALRLEDERIINWDIVRISPRGDLVAIKTRPPMSDFNEHDGHALLLDLETGMRIARLPQFGALGHFSPSGDLFMFWQSDDHGAHRQIGRWNPSTRQTVLTETRLSPSFEQLSPDGQAAFVQELDEQEQCRVLVWDLNSGRRRVLFEGKGNHLTRYSPETGLLAVIGYPLEAGTPIEGGETAVALVDVPSGKKYGEASCHGTGNVAFAPDGTRVLIFDERAGETRCRTMDLKTFAVLWESVVPNSRESDVTFDQDGDVVSLTSWRDARVVLLDGRTGATRAIVPLGPVPCDMALARKGVAQHGSYFRVSSHVLEGNAVVMPAKGFFGQWLDRLWPPRRIDRGHMETIIELRTGNVVFHSSDYGSITEWLSPDGQTLSLSPDGQMLIRNGRDEIRCYDVPERKPLRWVLGVPLAAGLGLITLRAAWRKLRTKKKTGTA